MAMVPAWIFSILIFYIAVPALLFYIGYRVLKAAIRNGIVEAHERIRKMDRETEEPAASIQENSQVKEQG